MSWRDQQALIARYETELAAHAQTKLELGRLRAELIAAGVAAVVADETERLRKELAEAQSQLHSVIHGRDFAIEKCNEHRFDNEQLRAQLAGAMSAIDHWRQLEEDQGVGKEISMQRVEVLERDLAEARADIAAMTVHSTTLEAENERWSTELTDAVNARNEALEQVQALSSELQDPGDERLRGELADVKEKLEYWQDAFGTADAETVMRWRASAKTPVEQAVLDAMAEVPLGNVRALTDSTLRGIPKLFKAELASRYAQQSDEFLCGGRNGIDPELARREATKEQKHDCDEDPDCQLCHHVGPLRQAALREAAK